MHLNVTVTDNVLVKPHWSIVHRQNSSSFRILLPLEIVFNFFIGNFLLTWFVLIVPLVEANSLNLMQITKDAAWSRVIFGDKIRCSCHVGVVPTLSGWMDLWNGWVWNESGRVTERWMLYLALLTVMLVMCKRVWHRVSSTVGLCTVATRTYPTMHHTSTAAVFIGRLALRAAEASRWVPWLSQWMSATEG